MKNLPITWQRFVKSGKTCDRCQATSQEMRRAIAKLKKVLGPIGITPVLKIKRIGEASFKMCPSESNRIWIAGKPMEDWVGGKVGMSTCCSVCGDSKCRTIKVGKSTFETIPEKLFLKAALAASSELL